MFFFQIVQNCSNTSTARTENLVKFSYKSSVIMSEKGTQQGDPEAPSLFAEKI